MNDLESENPSMTENNLLDSSYNPKKIEDAVREIWRSKGLRSRLEQKLGGKRKEGYVEGPPTLNGEPHMGHLRGRVMKDLWYRFETLRGRNIDFRGGWDCQGLPVELQAEKELGLTGDKTNNLKKIGEEKLVETCKSMLSKYHDIWHRSDELLGLMINDDKAYWTYRDSYIEREWQILRSAWNNGILSEGYRVTPFCPHCQTSLSSAEVALGGYQNLEDPSMYFKMKVDGQEGVYLVVWTTMPFTVVTDELVGVKPEAEYCYVKVKLPLEETWIVGADRLESLMKELRVESFEVIQKIHGKQLEGLKYVHPLQDSIPAMKELERRNEKVHTVVAEEFVDTTTGSGLVHMSPANGEDDFEVSKKRGIPVFNPIDERAVFTNEAGAFSGLFVRDADATVSEALKQAGVLLRFGRLKHEYPVCWRSGHRLVWLARREYFYFVDRLKERAVEAASNTEYYFEQPKNRFLEIIKEKRPWCISRERIWGSPLPIWKCASCNEKLGLFSRSEIVERAKSLPDGPDFELHRPWIDRIVISCPKCNSEMQREPFVLDTWHNSGAAPYASLSDEEHKNYLPLPFLTEGIDQTRGWAYTLLIENVILKMKNESPYTSFLFQGHVLDEKGEKLSKSKGNFIPVPQLLDKISIDLVRLYLMWKASPIDSVNFNQSEMMTRPYQILNTLYHMHVFYLQNSTFDGFRYSNDEIHSIQKHCKSLKKQDRWLLSKLEMLLNTCSIAYSKARYHEAARAIEHFLIDDFSQTYIPFIRSEMWEENEQTKKRRSDIYSVLGTVLIYCDLLLHPISPYLTDHLARKAFGFDFLLLCSWPEANPEFRNERLEVEFDLLSRIISLTNSARMKGKVKRRWPLRVAYYLVSENEKDLVASNVNILKEQINVSEIKIDSNPSNLPINVTAKPNYQFVAPRAKSRMNELVSAIESTDAMWVFNEIAKTGKAKLARMQDFELTASDLIFNFSSTDPKYIVLENFGTVIALDISRDDELVAQGLVRDIARNLQALRKEKGYNPTQILPMARIAGVGEQIMKMLNPKKEEIAFLVRASSVEILEELTEETNDWSTADIDGTEIRIYIA